jgi:hypothetical protein
MPSLVTLAEYKLAIGETDASRDTFHQQSLNHASSAILNESDRAFGAANVTESRTYFYDGKGILNIDECSDINSVTLQQAAAALPSTHFRPRKEGPPSVTVFSYLELPRLDHLSRRSMGVMGFTSNLDRLWLTGGSFPQIEVTVNADWGWTTIPDDIQRAVIWTAADFESVAPASGGSLAGKSVAEVSESYFQAQAAAAGLNTTDMLPERARAIVENYRRVRV